MRSRLLLGIAVLLFPIVSNAQPVESCRGQGEATDTEPVVGVSSSYPLTIEVPPGDAATQHLTIRICKEDLTPIADLEVRLRRYTGELPPDSEGHAPTTDLFESGHFKTLAERDLTTSRAGLLQVGGLSPGKYVFLVDWRQLGADEKKLVFDLRWRPGVSPITTQQGAQHYGSSSSRPGFASL